MPKTEKKTPYNPHVGTTTPYDPRVGTGSTPYNPRVGTPGKKNKKTTKTPYNPRVGTTTPYDPTIGTGSTPYNPRIGTRPRVETSAASRKKTPYNPRVGTEVAAINKANAKTREIFWKAVSEVDPDVAANLIIDASREISNLWSSVGYQPVINNEVIITTMMSLNDIYRSFREFDVDMTHFETTGGLLNSSILQQHWPEAVGAMSMLLTNISGGVATARKSYSQSSILLANLKGELTQLQQKMGQDTITMRTMEESYNKMSGDYNVAKVRLSQLESELSQVKAKHDTLYQEYITYQKDTGQTIDNYKREKADMKASLDQLTQNYNDLLEAKNSAEAVVRSYALEISNYNEDREKVIGLLHLDKGWNDTFSSIIQEILNRQIDTNNSLEKMTNKYQELKTKFSENEQKIQEYINQIEALKEDNITKAMELEAKSADYDITYQCLESARTEMNIMNNVKNSLEAKIEDLQKEIEGLLGKNNNYSEQLKQIQGYKDSISKLNKDIKDKDIIIQSQSLKISQYENTIKDYKTQIDMLTSERDNLEKDLNAEKELSGQLQTQVQELRSSLEQAQSDSADVVSQAINNETLYLHSLLLLNQTEQENIRLREANEELADTVTDLRRRMGEQTARIQELEVIIRERDEQINELLVGEDEEEEDLVQIVVEQPRLPLEQQRQLLNVGNPVRPLNPAERNRVPIRVPARVPEIDGGRPMRRVVVNHRRANAMVSISHQDRDDLSPDTKRARNSGAGGYVVGGRPDPNLSRAGTSFWRNVYNSHYRLF